MAKKEISQITFQERRKIVDCLLKQRNSCENFIGKMERLRSSALGGLSFYRVDPNGREPASFDVVSLRCQYHNSQLAINRNKKRLAGIENEIVQYIF